MIHLPFKFYKKKKVILIFHLIFDFLAFKFGYL